MDDDIPYFTHGPCFFMSCFFGGRHSNSRSEPASKLLADRNQKLIILKKKSLKANKTPLLSLCTSLN